MNTDFVGLSQLKSKIGRSAEVSFGFDEIKNLLNSLGLKARDSRRDCQMPTYCVETEKGRINVPFYASDYPALLALYKSHLAFVYGRGGYHITITESIGESHRVSCAIEVESTLFSRAPKFDSGYYDLSSYPEARLYALTDAFLEAMTTSHALRS